MQADPCCSGLPPSLQHSGAPARLLLTRIFFFLLTCYIPQRGQGRGNTEDRDRNRDRDSKDSEAETRTEGKGKGRGKGSRHSKDKKQERPTEVTGTSWDQRGDKSRKGAATHRPTSHTPSRPEGPAQYHQGAPPPRQPLSKVSSGHDVSPHQWASESRCDPTTQNLNLTNAQGQAQTSALHQQAGRHHARPKPKTMECSPKRSQCAQGTSARERTVSCRNALPN